MNRKSNKKKNQLTLKAGIFWGSILLITIAFFVMIGVKWAQSAKVITNYSKMEQLVGDEIFKNVDTSKNQTVSYYVFVYGSDKNSPYTTRVDELEDYVCAYLTYVNQNKKDETITKLYGFDIDNVTNEAKVSSTSNFKTTNYALFSIKEDDAPVLLKVTVTVDSGKATAVIDYTWDNIGAIKEVLKITK